MLTVGSLFAGIGGLELGLEQTGGFKTIWSVEINEFANEIRKRHWPDVPQFRDVREFPPREGIERPDVICGGSPCQDLSCAGTRIGIGGERSGLFLEMVRIVRELQPRYVVWENVRGAFSSNGGKDFRTVLGHFSDLGYDAEWTMLRASDFGASHCRARVFLLAYPNEIFTRRIYHHMGDSIRAMEKKEFQCAKKPLRGSDTITWPPFPEDDKKWAEIISECPHLSPTIEPHFRGMVNGVSVAVDDARFQRNAALGNAVVPACARWIGERILLHENKRRK